jgi:hypothetical protein
VTAPSVVQSRHYRFGGACLSVESDSTAVLEAVQARVHWAECEAPAQPDLVISFEMVDHLPELLPSSAAGRSLLDHPTARLTYLPDSDRLIAQLLEEGAAVIDPQASRARVYLQRTAGRTDWLGSHPMLTFAVSELLKRRGICSIHAAGAAVNGRAVLFAGASGVGKSTLSVALIRRGFGFLGDDRQYLKGGSLGLRVLGFPDAIDLRDGTPGLFEELRPVLSTPKQPGWPKWKLQAESYGVEIVRECSPGLLIFPVIGEGFESELQPLESFEALGQLARNVTPTDPAAARVQLDLVAMLVRTSDCYRLRTGRDFDSLAERLRELALALA